MNPLLLAVLLQARAEIARVADPLPPCGPSVVVGAPCIWQPSNFAVFSTDSSGQQIRRPTWVYVAEDQPYRVGVRSTFIDIRRQITDAGLECDPTIPARVEAGTAVASISCTP